MKLPCLKVINNFVKFRLKFRVLHITFKASLILDFWPVSPISFCATFPLVLQALATLVCFQFPECTYLFQV